MRSAESLSLPNNEEVPASGTPQNRVTQDKLAGLKFWSLACLPAVPLLIVYLYQTMGSAQFAFVPLAVALVGFLYWRRADGEMKRPVKLRQWMIAMAAMLLIFLSAFLTYPWFSALALVVLAAGALSSVRGTLRPSLLSLVAPLICILKPPFQLDALLTAWIHRKTSWLSSISLDFLRIPHEVDGSIIRLVDAEVLTSEATAGFLSLYLVLFLAFALMAWKNMSLWLLPFYAGAAILTTVFINAVRVDLHVIAVDSLNMDLSQGWYPLLLAVVGTGIAFGLLYSFHHLFAAAFHFVEPHTDAGINPLVAMWNQFSTMSEGRAMEYMSSRGFASRDLSQPPLTKPLSLACLGIVSVLFVFSAVRSFAAPSGNSKVASASTPLLIPPTDLFDSVPSQVGSLKYHVQEEKSPEAADRDAQHTAHRIDTWHGQFHGIDVLVQITQPLSGWGELTRGYQSNGWRVLDRDTAKAEPTAHGRSPTENPREALPFASARLRRSEPEQREGYLFFSAVSNTGEITETPTLWVSLAQRIGQRLGTTPRDAKDSIAMIQLLATSSQKMTPAEIRDLRNEFSAFRHQFARAIAKDAAQDTETPPTRSTTP